MGAAELEPQAEPRSLGLIKKAIGLHYGILDLLDVFAKSIASSTSHDLHAFGHQGGSLA